MHPYFRPLAFCLAVSASLAATSCGSKKDDPIVQPQAQTATLSGQISPAGSITTVTATDASGKASTATPGSTGTYSFPGLALGTYTLSFAPAAGYTAPANTPMTLVAGGTTAPTTTVAATPTTATLSGQISPAGAVTTVTATNASGTTVTATPGSTGSYTFPNLPFGVYTLTFAPASGYTAPAAATVTLVAGGTTAPTTTVAAAPTTATLTGQVNPAGAVTTVTATSASGVAVTAIPGSTGAYSFPNLPFGTYTITFATAGGYQPITTTPSVTLAAGGTTIPTVSTSQLPTRASYVLNGVTITPVYISPQVLGSDRFITFDTTTDQRITLFLQGLTPTVGTLSLTSTANYAQYNANDYVLYRSNAGSSPQGTLTITGVNTSARLYSGTFSFVGGVVNPNTGSATTKTITNGTFTNISY
ncbi:hypothetical protein ACVWYF_001236 [Hymenobacter sp. UYAg731]